MSVPAIVAGLDAAVAFVTAAIVSATGMIVTDAVVGGAIASAMAAFGVAEADAIAVAAFFDGAIEDLVTEIVRRLVYAMMTGVGPIAFVAQVPANDQEPVSMLDHVVLKKFADTIAANVHEAVQKQVKDDVHDAVQMAGDETKVFLASEKQRILKLSHIPFYGWVEGMPPAHPSCLIPRAPSHCLLSPTAPIESSKLKARAMDLFHSHARAKIATLLAEYKGKSPTDVHSKLLIDELMASQEWKDFMLTAAKDKAAKEA